MMHFVNAMGGMNREKEGQSMEQQSRNLKNLELFLEKEMDSLSNLKLEDFDITVPVTVACGSDDKTGMFHRSAYQAAKPRAGNTRSCRDIIILLPMNRKCLRSVS